MGLLKGKTEGGSGGKRGHSNMDHWVTSDEIKTATRKRRRLESKEQTAESISQGENRSPLKVLLPLGAEATLKELFEDANLDSVAWKRIEPSWYVRVDPELGPSAFDRFVSLLHAHKIRFEQISEELF